MRNLLNSREFKKDPNCIFYFSTKQEISVKYEEKAEENPTGFYDIVSVSNEYFAYTRGKDTEFFIREFTQEKEKKMVKSPDLLVMYCFTPDGSEIVAITSPDPITVPYKRVVFRFFSPISGSNRRFFSINFFIILYLIFMCSNKK